jgi:hypothetical protein
MNQKYQNARGYTAVIIAENAERVLYRSFEEKLMLQEWGSVSPKFFFDNWSPAT